MKLLVNTNDKNLDDYIQYGIDGFLLPLFNYSCDYTGSYSLDDILSLRKKYPDTQLFVILNEMIFNQDLTEVEEILKRLDQEKLDGILFYDWAIYRLVQKNNLEIPLIFHETHMLTNLECALFLKDKGITGGVLANEITLEEIQEMSHGKLELFQLLVGYPPAGVSRRKLLTNFYRNLKKEGQKELKIEEDTTKIPFYVKETSKSTSFLYRKRLNLISYYDTLNELGISYGIIKQDDLEKNTLLEVIDIYKNEKDKKVRQEKLGDLLGRNTGFFQRKTRFRVKK